MVERKVSSCLRNDHGDYVIRGHHLFGIHTLWKVDNMSMLRDSRAETLPNGLPDVDKHSCQLLGPTALVSSVLMQQS